MNNTNCSAGGLSLMHSGQRHLAALKRDIAIGIEQLRSGRFQTHNDANVMQYVGGYRPMENGAEIARVLHGARDHCLNNARWKPTRPKPTIRTTPRASSG